MSTRTADDRRLVPAANRFRSRRGRRWPYVAVAATALLAMVGGMTWVALGSGAFALRKVTVEGAHRVSVDEVVARAALQPGRSLFLVDPGSVAGRVEGLPAVADARVTRTWPHTLVIHVVERKPAGVVIAPSGATLLDADGVAFATQPSPPAGLVVVAVTGAVPGDGSDAARSAMRVVAALPRSIRRQIQQVTARTGDDVSLVLTHGRTVVWGSDSHNARKAQVLQVLLRRDATRYDVSVPDVAVTS